VSDALAGPFRPWLGERILEDGPELLVVDKPSGLVVHGGGVPRADVVGRLKRVLEARGDDPYLGLHHRLDVGTSGVLAFVRNRALNAAVQRDFETGAVRKRYVAAVEPPRHLFRTDRPLVLEHRLAFDGESARVVARGGKQSRTSVRALERVGARVLVEAVPLTGRTHQIRAQLAAVGAPIAGDRAYGGPAAARLLLHAAALELPGLGRRFEARVPELFSRWVAGEPDALGGRDELVRRFSDAACRRFPLVGITEAIRWVNGVGDELAGVVVDLYGAHATLAVSSAEAIARSDELAAVLAELGVRGVYLKVRERIDLRLARKRALFPPEPVVGAAAPELEVEEDGLRFRVALGDGLSTGLFIDQRDNRRRVRELAQGKTVLNLFSYTCSFSVAAAKGGARRVTSVDVSGRALARGVDNFHASGLDPTPHAFLREDAVRFLERAGRRGDRFDIVVLDPPSFASGRRGKALSAERDASRLVRLALAVVAPGGVLLAVTNHRGTAPATLRRLVLEAARAEARPVKSARLLPPGLDCPDGPDGPEPSKSVLVRLG